MAADDSLNETRQCRECGDEIETRGGWKPEDMAVCTDCWFSELSGDERREHAERARARREARRAE